MTGAHDLPGVVDFARGAEASGFDSVWVGDSLLARPRAEPLSILSAVASVTSRVTLGTAALIAPLRHPLLSAAQAVTVDQLSSGRLILGVGAGAPVPESRREFDALTVPFAGRSARLDETVRMWRHTWSGRGAFDGEYFCADDLPDLLPASSELGPPVWLAGGDAPAVLDRVADHYDGWLPYLPDPGAYAIAWQRIQERSIREIVPALYATLVVDGKRGRALDQLDHYTKAYYRQPLDAMTKVQAYCGGSGEECLDWLGHYVDAGARHLILRIGSQQPHPEELAERLLPALRSVARELP